MFRALWIKHWVQLRALRWVGFAVGIALPFVFWAGAEAAKRGWFGKGRSDYDLTSLIIDALPMGAAVLWGLLALMFSAQAFAGDRADGTERFLLDRPVSRRRTWLSRVLATLPSVLVVIAGQALYVWALATLVHGGTGPSIWTRIGTPLLVGAGLALLGTIGGMAAGTLMRNPMQAALVGAVLAALPIGVTMFFLSVFQLAEIHGLHLAFLLAPILPVALVVASYRASCLGEPAGRGRIQRGIVVLVVALVATPALFAATAPVVMRALVVAGWPQQAALEADVTVMLGGSYHGQSGWIIDTSSKEKIRFLKPPIRSTAWKADGSMLAVLHQAGALGSVREVRLELFDRDGESLRTFPVESESSYARGVHWAGELVLVREWLRVGRSAIRVLHPERGELGRIEVAGEGSQTWKLLGPTDDGSVFLHRFVSNDPRTYELNRLDLTGFRLEEPALIEEGGDLPTFAAKVLSPSGRYFARLAYVDKVYSSRIYDLQEGTRTDYPDSVIAGWLTGDRLLLLEKAGDEVRVVLRGADGTELLSRTLPRGVTVLISPDGRRFLVAQRAMADNRSFGYAYFGSIRGDDLGALLVSDGVEWTDLQTLTAGLDDEQLRIVWGGPNTLIVSDGAASAVADTDSGATWKGVLGRWR